MRVRKISLFTIAAVSACLALTACDTNDSDDATSPRPGTGSSADAPKDPGESCTDLLDYTGDPRSNAEINTIGDETGTCPEPEQPDTGEGTPKEPGVSCTDQLNYAGDPRSNAEINTIGEETGVCPPAE